jgi:hypothetical protein
MGCERATGDSAADDQRIGDNIVHSRNRDTQSR